MAQDVQTYIWSFSQNALVTQGMSAILATLLFKKGV